MKSQRQKIILDIISEGNIGNQEILRNLLLERGISVTQATLSRDMRELGIRKVPDENGGQKYSAEKRFSFDFPDFVTKAILSADHAGNIAVFRCSTGSAQAVCAVIDKDNCFGAVGTIAGDDTIFVLMRTEQDARRLSEDFMKSIGQ